LDGGVLRQDAQQLHSRVPGGSEHGDGRARRRSDRLHSLTLRIARGARNAAVRSTLGVLRPLARLVAPVLLALDLAGVTGDEPRLLEWPAKLGIRLEERAREAVPDGDGLRRSPPAADVDVG